MWSRAMRTLSVLAVLLGTTGAAEGHITVSFGNRLDSNGALVNPTHAFLYGDDSWQATYVQFNEIPTFSVQDGSWIQLTSSEASAAPAFTLASTADALTYLVSFYSHGLTDTLTLKVLAEDVAGSKGTQETPDTLGTDQSATFTYHAPFATTLTVDSLQTVNPGSGSDTITVKFDAPTGFVIDQSNIDTTALVASGGGCSFDYSVGATHFDPTNGNILHATVIYTGTGECMLQVAPQSFTLVNGFGVFNAAANVIDMFYDYYDYNPGYTPPQDPTPDPTPPDPTPTPTATLTVSFGNRLDSNGALVNPTHAFLYGDDSWQATYVQFNEIPTFSVQDGSWIQLTSSEASAAPAFTLASTADALTYLVSFYSHGLTDTLTLKVLAEDVAGSKGTQETPDTLGTDQSATFTYQAPFATTLTVDSSRTVNPGSGSDTITVTFTVPTGFVIDMSNIDISNSLVASGGGCSLDYSVDATYFDPTNGNILHSRVVYAGTEECMLQVAPQSFTLVNGFGVFNKAANGINMFYDYYYNPGYTPPPDPTPDPTPFTVVFGHEVDSGGQITNPTTAFLYGPEMGSLWTYVQFNTIPTFSPIGSWVQVTSSTSDAPLLVYVYLVVDSTYVVSWLDDGGYSSNVFTLTVFAANVNSLGADKSATFTYHAPFTTTLTVDSEQTVNPGSGFDTITVTFDAPKGFVIDQIAADTTGLTATGGCHLDDTDGATHFDGTNGNILHATVIYTSSVHCLLQVAPQFFTLVNGIELYNAAGEIDLTTTTPTPTPIPVVLSGPIYFGPGVSIVPIKLTFAEATSSPPLTSDIAVTDLGNANGVSSVNSVDLSTDEADHANTYIVSIIPAAGVPSFRVNLATTSVLSAASNGALFIPASSDLGVTYAGTFRPNMVVTDSLMYHGGSGSADATITVTFGVSVVTTQAGLNGLSVAGGCQLNDDAQFTDSTHITATLRFLNTNDCVVSYAASSVVRTESVDVFNSAALDYTIMFAAPFVVTAAFTSEFHGDGAAGDTVQINFDGQRVIEMANKFSLSGCTKSSAENSYTTILTAGVSSATLLVTFTAASDCSLSLGQGVYTLYGSGGRVGNVAWSEPKTSTYAAPFGATVNTQGFTAFNTASKTSTIQFWFTFPITETTITPTLSGCSFPVVDSHPVLPVVSSNGMSASGDVVLTAHQNCSISIGAGSLHARYSIGLVNAATVHPGVITYYSGGFNAFLDTAGCTVAFPGQNVIEVSFAFSRQIDDSTLQFDADDCVSTQTPWIIDGSTGGIAVVVGQGGCTVGLSSRVKQRGSAGLILSDLPSPVTLNYVEDASFTSQVSAAGGRNLWGHPNERLYIALNFSAEIDPTTYLSTSLTVQGSCSGCFDMQWASDHQSGVCYVTTDASSTDPCTIRATPGVVSRAGTCGRAPFSSDSDPLVINYAASFEARVSSTVAYHSGTGTGTIAVEALTFLNVDAATWGVTATGCTVGIATVVDSTHATFTVSFGSSNCDLQVHAGVLAAAGSGGTVTNSASKTLRIQLAGPSPVHIDAGGIAYAKAGATVTLDVVFGGAPVVTAGVDASIFTTTGVGCTIDSLSWTNGTFATAVLSVDTASCVVSLAANKVVVDGSGSALKNLASNVVTVTYVANNFAIALTSSISEHDGSSMVTAATIGATWGTNAWRVAESSIGLILTGCGVNGAAMLTVASNGKSASGTIAANTFQDNSDCTISYAGGVISVFGSGGGVVNGAAGESDAIVITYTSLFPATISTEGGVSVHGNGGTLPVTVSFGTSEEAVSAAFTTCGSSNCATLVATGDCSIDAGSWVSSANTALTYTVTFGTSSATCSLNFPLNSVVSSTNTAIGNAAASQVDITYAARPTTTISAPEFEAGDTTVTFHFAFSAAMDTLSFTATSGVTYSSGCSPASSTVSWANDGESFDVAFTVSQEASCAVSLGAALVKLAGGGALVTNLAGSQVTSGYLSVGATTMTTDVSYFKNGDTATVTVTFPDPIVPSTLHQNSFEFGTSCNPGTYSLNGGATVATIVLSLSGSSDCTVGFASGASIAIANSGGNMHVTTAGVSATIAYLASVVVTLTPSTYAYDASSGNTFSLTVAFSPAVVTGSLLSSDDLSFSASCGITSNYRGPSPRVLIGASTMSSTSVSVTGNGAAAADCVISWIGHRQVHGGNVYTPTTGVSTTVYYFAPLAKLTTPTLVDGRGGQLEFTIVFARPLNSWNTLSASVDGGDLVSVMTSGTTVSNGVTTYWYSASVDSTGVTGDVSITVGSSAVSQTISSTQIWNPTTISFTCKFARGSFVSPARGHEGTSASAFTVLLLGTGSAGALSGSDVSADFGTTSIVASGSGYAVTVVPQLPVPITLTLLANNTWGVADGGSSASVPSTSIVIPYMKVTLSLGTGLNSFHSGQDSWHVTFSWSSNVPVLSAGMATTSVSASAGATVVAMDSTTTTSGTIVVKPADGSTSNIVLYTRSNVLRTTDNTYFPASSTLTIPYAPYGSLTRASPTHHVNATTLSLATTHVLEAAPANGIHQYGLACTGATPQGVSGSGASWTFTVQPSTTAAFTCYVPANSFAVGSSANLAALPTVSVPYELQVCSFAWMCRGLFWRPVKSLV